MKRIAYAFFLIFILAAGVLVTGTALLASQADDYCAAGEITVGERADSSGVSVQLTSELAHHLTWDLLYDPASGASTASAGWSLPFVNLYTYNTPAYIGLRTVSDYQISWSSITTPDFDAPLIAGIYSTFLADSALSGETSISYPLSQFTSYLPVTAETRLINGLDTAALEELFRIPVPDWMTVRARLSHNSNPLYDTNYFSVYDETDGALSFDSDSVFAPDGWMYFVFDVRREGTRELLDGSQLPGGNWGVWRMRCTPQTDTSSPGWWNESFEVRCDLSTVENVFPLGQDGWDGAELELSHDGKYVLLFTYEGEDSYLTTIDAVTGEQKQRVLLTSGADSYLPTDIYQDEDWAVFDYYQTLVCALYEDGRYTPVFTAEAGLPTAPEWMDMDLERFTYEWSLDDCAFDGRYLYTMHKVVYNPERTAGTEGSEYYYVLSIRDENGTLYTEWLHTPLDVYYYDYNVNTTAKLRLPEPAEAA